MVIKTQNGEYKATPGHEIMPVDGESWLIDRIELPGQEVTQNIEEVIPGSVIELSRGSEKRTLEVTEVC